MKFEINESGKVFELFVEAGDGKDVTAEHVERFGASVGRFEEHDGTVVHRIGGGSFEAMLEAFGDIDGTTVWSDYR